MTEVAPKTDSSPSRLARVITRWSWLLLFLTAVATGMAMLASFSWWLELASHFRLQYLFAAMGLVVLFSCVKSKPGVLAAIVLVVANGAVIAPLYFRPDQTATTGPVLRLLIANVHALNEDHQRLLDLIAIEKPDLLLLQEANEAWLASLESSKSEYPYRISRTREDNFGVLVWSRVPLERAEVRFFGGSRVPSVEVRFEHGGHPVNVVLTHPLPPMRARHSRLRDEQLMAVAAAVRKLGPRTILVGDFNATPWCPIFRRLLEASGLRDSACGFGVQPTWPLMFPAPCRIPIDHCLHTPDFVVVDRRTGPDIGSDHMPMIVDLR